MKEKDKKEKSFFNKLHDKYRLVLMNDDTFEEKMSFRLTRFNVFVFFGTFAIFLIVATTYLIAFTPLREYIPGYADFNTRKVLRELMIKTDSLETVINQKERYIYNIRDIVEGRDRKDKKELAKNIPDSIKDKTVFDIDELPRSREDSLLRAEIESQTHHTRWNPEESLNTYEERLTFLFPPIEGIITNYFNPSKNHYGIDIVADENEAIKATADGTIVFANWTLETGYTIGIQHANNIFSVYKHNSVLLKDIGSPVKAGEAISIIGKTGILSTGTHLHFELWVDGRPVNPLDYIVL